MSQLSPEIEETIESGLLAKLRASCSLPVEGFIEPSAEGIEKRLDGDSFIGVKVGIASQDLDTTRLATFVTLDASVTVRFALVDDKDASAFRDECRRVCAVIRALTGDGCSYLSTDDIAVDGVMLASTNYDFEGGDEAVYTKTYSLTLRCRVLNSTTTTTNEEEAANG